MKMNYKHLGMYVLAGIMSGFMMFPTAFGGGLSSEHLGVYIFMTGIWLPISILVVGDSVSDMRCRSDWFSPLAFITLCCIGWWAAFSYGANNYSINFDNKCGWFCYPEMVWSGGIGGVFVGVGLALAWKVKRIGVVIVLTALAESICTAIPMPSNRMAFITALIM